MVSSSASSSGWLHCRRCSWDIGALHLEAGGVCLTTGLHLIRGPRRWMPWTDVFHFGRLASVTYSSSSLRHDAEDSHFGSAT
eukprot:2424154-Amphidinium_carterae.1